MRDRLSALPATGEKIVRGKKTRAWTLATLPPDLLAKLQTALNAKGFASIESMMRDAENAPAPAPQSVVPSAAVQFRDLDDWLHDYPAYTRKPISIAENEILWAESIRQFDALRAITEPTEHPAIKRSLVEFLLRRAPGLVRDNSAQPAAALRHLLDRKLAAFSKGGRAALRDGRETDSGKWCAPLCPDCWKKVVDAAILHEGNESLAWRQLKLNRRLCTACQDKHVFNVRRAKSYMPGSVRKAATPLVDAVLPWRKSNAAGRAAGPHIPRDWNDTAPGGYFVADDVTWNLQVYDFRADGTPRFFRPECLYIADERTSYPLCFLLIDGHYNGRHIRQLLLDAHERFGLPHEGFKFENAIWRSRTVRDEACPDWISFSETEDGFLSLPDLVKIRHFRPRNPRAKVIEGDFRALQARMAREAGNVGTNERDTKSDAIKNFVRRARAGKETPESGALHISQFARLLSAIFEEFASEPQNGARLPGISPAEAWKAGKPLRKLPDELRYILATCRRLVTVQPDGIRVLFSKKESWSYSGPQLAEHIGRQVWAHWHFDCPEFLTVMDMKKANAPFSVKGVRLPANNASREQMADAHGQIDGFNRVAKTIAGGANNPFASSITRDNDYTPAQREAGRAIEAEKAEHVRTAEHEIDARARRRNEGLSMLREHLMTPDAAVPNEGSP